MDVLFFFFLQIDSLSLSISSPFHGLENMDALFFSFLFTVFGPCLALIMPLNCTLAVSIFILRIIFG